MLLMQLSRELFGKTNSRRSSLRKDCEGAIFVMYCYPQDLWMERDIICGTVSSVDGASSVIVRKIYRRGKMQTRLYNPIKQCRRLYYFTCVESYYAAL
jgi:hypothetical protein